MSSIHPSGLASGSNLALSIDLNLDAGEDERRLEDGSEERLYQLVSSVNVACGGHAGSRATIEKAVALAMRHQLAIGAHPGFPDKVGFGRLPMQMPREQLLASLIEQIELLFSVCQKMGAVVTHLKPHGALYNLAALNSDIADTILEAASQVQSQIRIVGLAGSVLVARAREQDFRVANEAFVDRRYEPNGQLRARHLAGALIDDPALACRQAIALAKRLPIEDSEGRSLFIDADTLCIHGDGINSFEIAKAVREALQQEGFSLLPLDH